MDAEVELVSGRQLCFNEVPDGAYEWEGFPSASGRFKYTVCKLEGKLYWIYYQDGHKFMEPVRQLNKESQWRKLPELN